MTDVTMIPIDRIVPDDYYQPRTEGINERHVRLLVATDPASWAALLVTPDEHGQFNLIDGFHRLEAARRLGLPVLPCRVDPEADYFSGVAANITHGLPLTMADRKVAARWLAKLTPSLSYREIGRRCGLHHETVKRALEEGDGEPGDRRHAAPDPIRALVKQVDRTYRAGHGRTWLGLGKDARVKPFQQEIASYADEDQADVARALNAFGHACVASAQPFLMKQG